MNQLKVPPGKEIKPYGMEFKCSGGCGVGPDCEGHRMRFEYIPVAGIAGITSKNNGVTTWYLLEELAAIKEFIGKLEDE